MERVGVARRAADLAWWSCPLPRSDKCKIKGLVEKRRVFLGLVKKTKGGLQAEDLSRKLTKGNPGRVVSTKRSKASLKLYEGSKLQKWNAALKQARVQLGLETFVKVGKGPNGEALLKETRRIYADLLSA